MTYCEGIGLAIGDKIRVLRDSKQKFFAVGDLLTLSEDDGTQQPWFRNQHNRVICFGLTGGHTDGDKGEGIGWIRLDESGEVKLSGYPPICAPAHDPVNKPSHYMLFPEQGIEFINVRDVLIERLKNFSPKQIDYWSRAFEYLARAGGKNGIEDIKKAKWYLDRLVATLEEQK